MKSYMSRLKSFDLESMSGCTPQATGIRASVENVVSDYGLGDLWRLVERNPEQVRLDNPSNAKINSTSPCTSDFTGRVSII